MYISVAALVLMVGCSMFIGQILGRIEGEAKAIANLENDKYKN